MDKKLYNEKSIESLSPLEFTRLRPGVYAGDTTYSTQLLVEIVSNAIDEFRLGHGNVIEVTLNNGDVYAASLIATDSKTDLAVIKIETTGLTAAILGDSDALVVGEDAIAIGNPLGELGGTVTNGIISALDREVTVEGQKMNLLQTNAAINPGNSGGGLFNAKGELIGIVSAKSSGTDIEGLGFAIPVNDVKEVVVQLIEKGYVAGRPALGVSVIDINSIQLAMQYGVSQYGVYIAEVLEDSAAEKAGL
jgi:serine protease Do